MPEVARYVYQDAEGKPVYEAVRIEPGSNGRSKDFLLERVLPDNTRQTGHGAMEGVARIPYQLPLLLAGIAAKEVIYFVEGEKCADSLIKEGLVATTRSEGALASIEADGFLNWFQGAQEIVVLPDCDIPGRQAAVKRAILLCSIPGASVRNVDLSPARTDGYDVADFLAEGRDVTELAALVQSAPVYDPPVIPKQEKTTNGPEAARIFTLADLLQTAVRRTEDAVENGPRVQASPWEHLNSALGGNVVSSGFSPTETAIWAAVPGGGKSAATWMVADHAAANHEGTAVIASIEMGEIDAVQRLISLYSGITTSQLRSGQLSSTEWEKLAYTQRNLGDRRLAILGRDGRNLDALHKSLETIASKTKISCVVVDHLGKINQAKSDTRNRNDSVEDVIEALANMAIEYDCVMHVVQHLNRVGYGQRPTLGNLRDGGNTEGHANIVIFPYRQFPNAPQLERREKGELILEKCRDGFTGSLPMKYTGERYMWTEAGESVWFENEHE
jgi:DnaB-like helicase C terminal domain